jgi:hypothetical protein
LSDDLTDDLVADLSAGKPEDGGPAHYRTTRRWLLALVLGAAVAAVAGFVIGGGAGALLDAELHWWRAVRTLLPF